MRKKRKTPNYQYQTKQSKTSGILAEKAIKDLFNLEEPYIEVKACSYDRYKAVVSSTQLKKQLDKSYVIVVYRRYRFSKTIDGKKDSWAGFRLSIEEAFKEPMDIYWIKGASIKKVIKEYNLPFREPTKGKPYYELKWKAVQEFLVSKYGSPIEYKGNRVYGVVPEQEEIPF